MYVKVLHPDGEITNETLCLYIDFLMSGHMGDNALTLVSNYTGKNLCDSPIQFHEKLVLDNSDYISHYTNGKLQIDKDNVENLEDIDKFHILMLEEQYQKFYDTFDKISSAWENFCYEYIKLISEMKDAGMSDDEFCYKQYEYMNYPLHEENINDWVEIIHEMTESARKEREKLLLKTEQ